MTMSRVERERVPELRVGVMRLARRMRNERPDDALTASQLAVLGTLVRHGPLTPRALSQIERVQPPSMTRMLGVLETEGLIDKQPDPTDGRQVVVSLTDVAQAKIQVSRERKDAWLSRELDQMTPEDRNLVLKAGPLLNRLALLE
jgi:DNA-binding MarR family transcriptional regulator